MAKGFNIKIEGLEHLAGQLEKLKSTAQGEDVQRALLDGAQLIQVAARSNAPTAPYPTWYKGRMIAPGGLKASLSAAPGRKIKNFLQAYAFALKQRAPHAHLVEFGTKPHVIQAKDKKVLAFGNRFRRFARKVMHSGSREIPFFRTAIKQQRNAVKRLLETKVKAAFDALARTA
jgi:HK97 gp10 family phage protein